MPAKKKPVAKRAPTAKPKAAAPDVPALLVRLAAAIPAPRCELDHRDAWTLLIATILAAQSTDRTVNTVTPELFRRWPTPAALAAAERAEVEQAVYKTGFFRNKAKAIQECSRMLVGRHGGEVPRTIEALVELPGVARKTANVVLGIACGIAAGMAVDTHVTRLSQLLGLSRSDDPVRIEQDLCALVPKADWIEVNHRLVLHGRYVCTAKKPACGQCPLNELCAARQAPPTGTWQERAVWEQQFVASGGGRAV